MTRDDRRAGHIIIAVGFVILMATLTVVNIEDAGVLDDLVLGDVVTVFSASALALLTVGLFTRRSPATQVGFLCAMVTYALRSSFILLTEGPSAMGVWLSLGGAVIAAGVFLIEHWGDQAAARIRAG